MSQASRSVFISYNHRDRAEALALNRALRAAGVATFIDEERIDGTEDFELVIHDALRSSITHVIVVLSPDAADSRWVRFEVLAADRAGKTILLYTKPDWPPAPFFDAWEHGRCESIEEVSIRIGEDAVAATKGLLRWNLSSYPSPEFVGRREDADALYSQLRGLGTPVVITGLGGIGKTQLALEHIYLRFGDYDLIWWVRSSDASTAIGDLAALGLELELPGADQDRLPETAALVREWLSERDRWLVVFDDVGDPATIAQLVCVGGGHTIVTSRRTDWPWPNVLELDPLSEETSIDFLSRRTQRPESLEMREVAALLGGLPLAVAQAGAYIAQTNLPFGEYRDRFRQRRTQMLEAGVVLESDERVATTWDISFQEAESRAPISRHILGIAAFLAAVPVPRSLFGPLAVGASAEGGVNAALHELAKLSLLSLGPTAITLHGLVQDVFRERLEDRDPCGRACLALLSESLPQYMGDRTDHQMFSALTPHVLSSTRHAQERGRDTRLSMTLLEGVGDYQVRRGLLLEGKESLQRALVMGEGKFGPESPVLLKVLNQLGLALEFVGEYEAAEASLLRALGIVGESPVYSEQHRLLRSNLGALYHAMGEHSEAQRILEPFVTGADSLDSSTVVADSQKLGQAYMDLGRHSEAETIFLRVLEQRQSGRAQERQELGQSHADLGKLYSLMGASEKAERHLNEAVGVYRETLGDEHLFLAVALVSRASHYKQIGKSVEALGDFAEARGVVLRLGGDHPYLAAISLHLAELSIANGRTDQAREYLNEADRVCRTNPRHTLLAAVALRTASMLRDLPGAN